MVPQALRLLVSLLMVTTVAAVPAAAQGRPSPTVELAAGVGTGADNETGGYLDGAARIYVSPRISVGPDVVFSLAGRPPVDLMLSGNVTFDFVRPKNGESPHVVPFAFAGGGVFLTRKTFHGATFTGTDGTFGGGGGIRVRAGRHVLAGVKARVGFIYFAAEGFVGVQFGR